MLAAAHRLRRSHEFAAAIRSGRRAGRGALVVHLTLPESRSVRDPHAGGPPGASTETDRAGPPACPSETVGLPVRAGFVVSRAVGDAVTRNRVRRRLRQLVRERLDRFPPGTALVVRALPAAAGSPYARLALDLDEALAVAAAPRPRRRPGPGHGAAAGVAPGRPAEPR